MEDMFLGANPLAEAHLILDEEATLGDKKWSRKMPLPSLACISCHPRPTGPFTNDV